jgi:hypothetical protein
MQGCALCAFAARGHIHIHLPPPSMKKKIILYFSAFVPCDRCFFPYIPRLLSIKRISLAYSSAHMALHFGAVLSMGHLRNIFRRFLPGFLVCTSLAAIQWAIK